MKFSFLLILILLVFLTDLSSNNVIALEEANSKSSKCNIYEGSWIYDNTSDPLYQTSTCPFIGLDCQNFGRPDKNYLYYRWQPTGCNIPRFNGQDFLRRLKGKKMLFVGDSLSNNMWVSLKCILHTAVPNANYTFQNTNILSTFTIPEYGISINFLKNGFLVDLVADKRGLILKLDSISTGNQWLGSDVVIFNTFHWWSHIGRAKTWKYFQVGNETFEEMNRMEAFKIALTTWAKWVDLNIDTSKTKVFYQGVSPVHLVGGEWGKPRKTCLGETEPVKGPKYPGPNNEGEGIVRSVIGSMAKPVSLLDVTVMSELRKDCHPSVYAGGGKALNDCSHWCLPGLPDVWNQLLYTALITN